MKSGMQRLSITGLRFEANLGILDHELASSQPISVDVELNQGHQPLLPSDDHISSVLDYRLVHNTIIEVCQEQHVNLLESMTGKLCQRLSTLPGVLGVRARVVKLRIFDDCEVAIQMETGEWNE
jgi:dihydroneopterin aldolase